MKKLWKLLKDKLKELSAHRLRFFSFDGRVIIIIIVLYFIFYISLCNEFIYRFGLKSKGRDHFED